MSHLSGSTIPRRVCALSISACAIASLSGCLTRQVWQPSHEADAANAVEVPMVGRYEPEREVPHGAGGTAWRGQDWVLDSVQGSPCFGSRSDDATAPRKRL